MSSSAPPGSGAVSTDSWESAYLARRDGISPTDTRARSLTKSGLGFMAVGLILLWIPLLSWFGLFFAFLGVAFLWFGRRAFNDAYRRGVNRGCALIATGLAIQLAFAILLYVWIDLAAAAPGQTVAGLLGAFRADLTTYVVASYVSAVVLALGVALVPYARADNISRELLWGGLGFTIVLSGLALNFAYGDVLAAVAAAGASYPANTGPLVDLQYQLLYLGLLSAVPDLLFAWAYLRVRSRQFPRPTARAPLSRAVGAAR